MFIIIFLAVFVLGILAVGSLMVFANKRHGALKRQIRIAKYESEEAMKRAKVAEQEALVAENTFDEARRQTTEARDQAKEARRLVQDAERERDQSERLAEDANNNCMEAKRRAEEAEQKLDIKRHELVELEDELRHKKREVGTEIAAWSETETARLKERFEQQYESEVAEMELELNGKVQAEFERIHQAFADLGKSKKELANKDIQDFLDAQISMLQSQS